MTEKTQPEIDPKKGIFEISIDTRMLYECLAKSNVGDLISYTQLNEIINQNVQKEARHLMMSARRIARRENQLVFDCVANVGLKRLNDVQICNTETRRMDHIRRTSKEGIRDLACVQDFNALPNDAKIKHNAGMALYGILSELTRISSVKRIEAKVREKHETLTLTETLDAFIKR